MSKPFLRKSISLVTLLSLTLWGEAFPEYRQAIAEDGVQVAMPTQGTPPAPPESASGASNGSGGRTVVEPEEKANSEIASDLELQWPEVENGKGQVRELSVPPNQNPILPLDRPAWVGADPNVDGDVHEIYVGSLPTSRLDRLEESLNPVLIESLSNYIDQYLITDSDSPASRLQSYITPTYIRTNLIDDPEGFVAELTTSEGPMYQQWVIVRVTPEQQEQMVAWHREALQRSRLAPLGLGVFAIIAVVGLSHLVLRRIYGLAPTTPLTKGQILSATNPDGPAGRQRPARGQGGSWLKVGLGILLLPVMIGLAAAALLGVYQSRAERVHARQHKSAEGLQRQLQAEISSEIEKALGEESKAASFRSQSGAIQEATGRTQGQHQLPEPPNPPRMNDQQHGKVRVITGSGNQQIIIRKRH